MVLIIAEASHKSLHMNNLLKNGVDNIIFLRVMLNFLMENNLMVVR